MVNSANNRGIKICFFAGGFIFMSYMGLAGAIAGIAEFFPEYSVEVVQTGVTAINLMIIVGAISAGWIFLRASKKKKIIFGLTLIAAGGIGGYFFHDSIYLFYLWSIVIGFGFGHFTPTVSSLMIDYFEGAERNRMAGMQTSFVNGGGMLLTFTGGVLAAIAWNASYLIFLVAIPIFIIFAVNLPAKNEYDGKRADLRKIPKSVAYYSASVIALMMVYNAFPSNIALYLSENDFGNASLAGGVNAVFMAGGVFFGFVFSKFSLKIGDHLFAVAHFMIVICYFTLCFTGSLIVVFIVAFAGGMSISMTMPQAMYSVAARIPPQTSVAVFSLIASISPNIASFSSPTVIGFLSRLFSDTGDSISRLMTAGTLALIFAVLQVIVLRSRRKAYENQKS